MNRFDVLDRLDQRIAARSILQHPFYVAWERGELTRAQLATYARVYFPHVRAFPDYLRSALALADDPATRDELASNLHDELSEPKQHAEMWLDFADAVGADRDAIETAPPSSGAAATVNTFQRLARRDLSSGVAALYAYESQQPEVSQRKLNGLRDLYDVHDPEGLAYFEVHATADLEHRRGEREVLSRCLQQGTEPAAIEAAAEEALDAYWGLLDEVCAAADVTAD